MKALAPILVAIFLVSSSHVLAAGKKQVTPPPGEETLWVAKGDNAKSCEKDSGIRLEVMAGELRTGGVEVLAKKKLHDSKMRIQMCGADSGAMNGFLIKKKDAEKAVVLGFQLYRP